MELTQPLGPGGFLVAPWVALWVRVPSVPDKREIAEQQLHVSRDQVNQRPSRQQVWEEESWEATLEEASYAPGPAASLPFGSWVEVSALAKVLPVAYPSPPLLLLGNVPQPSARVSGNGHLQVTCHLRAPALVTVQRGKGPCQGECAPRPAHPSPCCLSPTPRTPSVMASKGKMWGHTCPTTGSCSPAAGPPWFALTRQTSPFHPILPHPQPRTSCSGPRAAPPAAAVFPGMPNSSEEPGVPGPLSPARLPPRRPLTPDKRNAPKRQASTKQWVALTFSRKPRARAPRGPLKAARTPPRSPSLPPDLPPGCGPTEASSARGAS